MADTPTLSSIEGKSGQDIYDEIMKPIDEELTSDQIPLLAERYKDESPEDRVKRAKRYNEAFAKFDELAAGFMHAVRSEKDANRKMALASAEAKVRAEEEVQLKAMESQFS